MQGVELRDAAYLQVEHGLVNWVWEQEKRGLSKRRRTKQRGRKRRMREDQDDWEEDNGVPNANNI
jgi:hypothetical protein